MVYYSAMKRNKLLIHAATWTDLKDMMQDENKPILRGYTTV